MKTLGDPDFVQTLAVEDSNEEALPPVHGHKKGKPVEIHIIQRSKGKILMFPEEWDD